MHVAAVGVTVTLLGVCAAVPECWPEEVDQAEYLTTTMRLTQEVVSAARAIHGLGDPKPAPTRRPRSAPGRGSRCFARRSLCRPAVRYRTSPTPARSSPQ